MKVSKLSLASLLVTGRLVVRFTSNEAGSVGFTVTTTVAGRAAAPTLLAACLWLAAPRPLHAPARRG